jgi:hypothetical protein
MDGTNEIGFYWVSVILVVGVILAILSVELSSDSNNPERRPTLSPSIPTDPQEKHAYDLLRKKHGIGHDDSASSAKIIKEMVERDKKIRNGTYRRP